MDPTASLSIILYALMAGLLLSGIIFWAGMKIGKAIRYGRRGNTTPEEAERWQRVEDAEQAAALEAWRTGRTQHRRFWHGSPPNK